jgi:hypothetical protein
MFERIYDSTWHHPVLFWVIGGPLLLALLVRLRRRDAGPGRFVAIWAVVFQLEILLDAWCTSPWSPFADSVKTSAAIVFVILGDLRYFVLLGRFARREGSEGGVGWRVMAAMAASLVVPLASWLVAPRIAPGNSRVLFLVYELLFAAFALALRFLLLSERSTAGAARPKASDAWLRRVTWFEIVQYALWASADVVILTGHDVGFLLRLVPNTLYYAAFVPFAGWSFPRDETS